jgi:hypothetical protein
MMYPVLYFVFWHCPKFQALMSVCIHGMGAQTIVVCFFLIRFFFIYISNAIPFPSFLSKIIPYTLTLTLLPNLPTSDSWPWHSPVLGHIIFARLRGLSSHWWLTRPSSATYAARDTSSGGVLVSSYCCSIYRVADPFSSLGTFSSSSIGGPVLLILIFHMKAASPR